MKGEEEEWGNRKRNRDKEVERDFCEDMARNEKKVQSMLSRFLQAKNEEKKKPKERRLFLASECRDLADADKWRQQII